MKLNDLKIRTRLVLGSVFVLALLLIAAAVGIVRIERLQDRMKGMTHAGNVEARLASTMRDIGMELRMSVDNVAMLTDMAAKQAEADRIRSGLQQFNQARNRLQDLLVSAGTANAERRGLLAKASSLGSAVDPIIAKTVELGLAGRNEQAIQVLEQGMPALALARSLFHDQVSHTRGGLAPHRGFQ